MATAEKVLISDRFEIHRAGEDALVGEGGMGAVYKGKDRQTGEQVAIKVMKTENIARDPEMFQRFIREGEALRKLNHPSIVKTYGAYDQDGVRYLIMEYVSGGSLRDLLIKKHRLSVQQTLYIALDLADALTRAHRLDILHRDIKPDNVLLAEDGTPRLTDFGMARMGKNAAHITQDGAVVGTLAYMAPELFEGVEADERTDIWAFGVMLFEMLTGERPFPYEMPGQLINAIMTHPIPDLEAMCPDAPTALIDLIYRMLSKERPARIPSVRLIGAELEAIIQGGTTSLQPVVTDSTGRFEVITPTPQPAPATGKFTAPNNLPAQPTAFVGRERELEELQKMLADPGSRLVTLVAPGGMGKTRLALALAERQLATFNDGVYFVPLTPIENESYLPRLLAEALDFTFGGGDHKTELLNYLREKHILLLLDNCELVMNSVNFVADMLQAAPNLKIIATSRERLRLRSEQVYEIGGLTLPKKRDETPEKLADFPVVKLFMQSAHRVMPDLTLDETTVPHVAQICRMVDGMPLAVELAAAWLDMLPLDEIASEIERSLDFLESNLRDVPERQRSVRAIFEYSWNLLTEEERDTFIKLSVFEGSFEREAAQSISGASLRTLTSLINKSLLQRDANGRYLPHKLLRQYAVEYLEKHPEKHEVYKAFGMYYARFLEKIEPVLSSSKEQSALDAMELEMDNVRGAWQRAIAVKKWEVLDKIIQAIMLYYLGRGASREGAEQFQQLAAALKADGQTDTLLYWRVRVRQAWMSSRLGNYEEVYQTAKSAYDYFKQHKQSVEMCYALNAMSYARMMQGRLPEAYDYAAEANEQVNDMLDKTAWFMAMGNLAYIAFLMGNYDEARMMGESIIHTAGNVDYSPSGIAQGKNNLGETLRSMGEVDEACRLFQEAYDTFASIHHRRGMAFTLNNLAGMLFWQGEYDRAHAKYEAAYQLHREVGDRTGLGHSLSALGNIASTKGDFAGAKIYFEEALKIRRDTGDRRGMADSMIDLATVEINREGDMARALQMATDALALYQEIGNREGTAYALPMRSLAYYRLGHLDAARADVETLMNLAGQLNNPLVQAQAYMLKGEVAAFDGHHAEALAIYKVALRHAKISEVTGFMLYTLTGIAGVLAATGENEKALRIVTLVLMHPRNFITMVEKRAQAILKDLEQKLDKDILEATGEHSQSLALTQLVDELLAE